MLSVRDTTDETPYNATHHQTILHMTWQRPAAKQKAILMWKDTSYLIRLMRPKVITQNKRPPAEQHRRLRTCHQGVHVYVYVLEDFYSYKGSCYESFQHLLWAIIRLRCYWLHFKTGKSLFHLIKIGYHWEKELPFLFVDPLVYAEE